MIKRHEVKSCCGHKSLIFEADRPIRRFQLSIFEKEGFVAPPSFIKIGTFYVRSKHIFASTHFGSKNINVKCIGDDCDKYLDEFEALLDRAVHTQKIEEEVK